MEFSNKYYVGQYVGKEKPGQETGLSNSALPHQITAVQAVLEQLQRQPERPELRPRRLPDRGRCRSARYSQPSPLHALRSDLPTGASFPRATYRMLQWLSAHLQKSFRIGSGGFGFEIGTTGSKSKSLVIDRLGDEGFQIWILLDQFALQGAGSIR